MNFHKFKKLVLNLLSSSTFENGEYISNIELKEDRNYGDPFLVVTFHDGLELSKQNNLLDDMWKTIYNYTGQTVYLVNKNKTNKRLNEQSEESSIEKKKKIVERFLQTLKVKSVEGFWTSVDEGDDTISVYLIINMSELPDEGETNRVVALLRRKVKEKIVNYTGIEPIYVGSVAKRD